MSKKNSALSRLKRWWTWQEWHTNGWTIYYDTEVRKIYCS